MKRFSYTLLLKVPYMVHMSNHAMDLILVQVHWILICIRGNILEKKIWMMNLNFVIFRLKGNTPNNLLSILYNCYCNSYPDFMKYCNEVYFHAIELFQLLLCAVVYNH
jgi:hypothetical protein